MPGSGRVSANANYVKTAINAPWATNGCTKSSSVSVSGPTIGGWQLYPTSAGFTLALLGKITSAATSTSWTASTAGNGISLQSNSSGKWQFAVGASTLQSRQVFTGKPSVVFVTYNQNGTQGRMWVNGVDQGTLTFGSVSGSVATIGFTAGGTAGRNFGGTVLTAAWARVLVPDEVIRLSRTFMRELVDPAVWRRMTAPGAAAPAWPPQVLTSYSSVY